MKTRFEPHETKMSLGLVHLEEHTFGKGLRLLYSCFRCLGYFSEVLEVFLIDIVEKMCFERDKWTIA